MNYYTKNYKEYIEKTLKTDMSVQYAFFEKYLKNKKTIWDVGFGSARDMLYFKSKGYDVYGIDLEENFVKNAKKLNLNVEVADVMTYKTDKKFDAIWCSASLLHLKFNDIKKAIDNLKRFLNTNGIIYISFKYGDFEGYIDNRYFTYINDEKLKKLNLNIIDKITTNDSLNRDIKWISIII